MCRANRRGGLLTPYFAPKSSTRLIPFLSQAEAETWVPGFGGEFSSVQ